MAGNRFFGAVARIAHVALAECASALRTRRVLVLVMLYVASAACCMYCTISIFRGVEQQVAQSLGMKGESVQTGQIFDTLWRHKDFQAAVKSIVGNDAVYKDIRGRSPVELVYAWFVFFCAPLLVVMVSGNRIASDVSSGAVRYSIVRCTRYEWSLGKYAGQAFLLVFALAASALGAWCVAACRLPRATLLLPSLLDWGARAWLYSVSWLGLALGISHITRSGGKALALGILAIIAFSAFPGVVGMLAEHNDSPWLLNLRLLSPSSAKTLLWRRSAAPLAEAAARLVGLGLIFLSAGSAVFRRRDA